MSPASIIWAGMPSVSLSTAASLRLQSISFFLALFLVSGLVIRWIWNSLRTDFPRLPLLSYPRALALVGLWGLLFLLVLTMISGARELMTPGAWKSDGVTHVLNDGKSDAVKTLASEPSESERRQKLLALYAALALHALKHNGQYPQPGEGSIPAGLWKTPHASGMRYLYRPPATGGQSPRILAFEPEIFAAGRLVLFTDGDVKRLSSLELEALLAAENTP